MSSSIAKKSGERSRAVVVDRKVLVVEDDDFVRGLILGALLEYGFETVHASDAAAAMELLESEDPDALVTDIHLGVGPTGVDLIHSAVKFSPGIAVLAISNYPDSVSAGVGTLPENAGFVCKSDLSSSAVLIEALEMILTGQEKAGLLATAPSESPVSRLTPSQIDVLRLVASGWSNEMIAKERSSSVRATEQMIHRIFVRLGVGSTPGRAPRVEATNIYSRAFGVPR